MTSQLTGWLAVILALVVAPLLPGIINKTKAMIAGRRGFPAWQMYLDLAKLLRKGAVYSTTTTFLFRFGPLVSLAALLIVILLVPFSGEAAPLAFAGDLILFAYLFALLRLFTVVAALDTGSSFEGMGGSRELFLASLTEPALFCILIVLAKSTTALTLSVMLGAKLGAVWQTNGGALILTAVSLFAVLLTENARIPVDDPNTHLELTMIHEVMVLDHSGPDLAVIQYAAALKLLILESFLWRILLPFHFENLFMGLVMFLVGLLVLSIGVGVIESVMARLRLLRLPQFLIAATILAAFAIFLTVG